MEERLREILRIALQYHVTDIHFNVKEKNGIQISVEMRIAGEMYEMKEHPDDLRLFYYLMYRSNLDVSDVMRPQTGSFRENVDGSDLSLRFALVTSYHITSGVLRILNNHPDLRIEQLCEDPDTVSWMKSITKHRSGLYLFSGPTGSGKTTTLYTILNECSGKKIFTLEDPVEVVNENYVQLQINERQQFSYAEGIRQLMRHDPDIIMIGEIRDDTAAKMAVRSALTGHLVVSSIHSSSCVSAIERMIELGVSRTQLQDVLEGVSNQRLFDTERGKTGIYEIMKGKEVSGYLGTGHRSEECRTLEDRIREAADAGIISSAEAEGYLAG